MRFYYRVRNESGDEIAGEIDAPSRLEALRRLASDGWRVEYCDTKPPQAAEQGRREARPTPAAQPKLRLFPPLMVVRPAPAHLATFYHQLGQLLGAGVSPHEAALRLAQQAPSAYLKLAMAEVAPALAQGGSLVDALSRYPQLFPPEAIGLLRAAERSGDWAGICADLEAWYTSAYRGSLWYVVARLYYGILLLLALLVPYFPYIISRGVSWYISFLLTHIVPAIAGLAVLWAALRIFAGHPATRPLRERLALSLPLVRAVAMRAAAARFLRAFASLLAAGIEPGEAMDLAAGATGYKALEALVHQAADDVRRGVAIDQAVARLRFLDDRQRSVLSTAFSAGRLDEGLAFLVQTATESAAAAARMSRFATQGLLFMLISAIAGAAFIMAVLNYYRSFAEAWDATDLWKELF